MNRPSYVLTRAAEAGLREIIRHTYKEWGDAQVRRYIDALEQGMVRLATGRGPFKDMGAVYPALRMSIANTTTCFVCRVNTLLHWSWPSSTSAWI